MEFHPASLSEGWTSSQTSEAYWSICDTFLYCFDKNGFWCIGVNVKFQNWVPNNGPVVMNTKFPKIASFTGNMELLAMACGIIMNHFISNREIIEYIWDLPLWRRNINLPIMNTLMSGNFIISKSVNSVSVDSLLLMPQIIRITFFCTINSFTVCAWYMYKCYPKHGYTM